MKRKVMAASILLGVSLGVCTVSQAAWKLAKELNPQGRKWWVTISDREAAKFFPMKRYHLSRQGLGFGLLNRAEGFIQSGSPTITAFSPDQISLEKIDPRYRYIFVIPVEKVKEILAEDKCVIVSRKVKINVTRQTLDDKGEWVVVSETEGESYVTLVAAPNKKALKKAIARFFKLKEIPLEPIIFGAK